MSETTDHLALAHFLRVVEGRLPMLAFCKHCPNEALDASRKVMLKGRAVPLEVLKGAAMGVRAGVWDWELIGGNAQPLFGKPAHAYGGLAIELKSARYAKCPDAGLTDEQLAWRVHYVDQGWYTAVFADWGAAAELLVLWAGGNPAAYSGLIRGGTHAAKTNNKTRSTV